MTPEIQHTDREALDWDAIRDGDTMIAEGETLEWLITQLVEWPRRIHPERTTNDSFLRCSAARTLEALAVQRVKHEAEIALYQKHAHGVGEDCNKWADRAVAAEALLAEAREVIEPFALGAKYWDAFHDFQRLTALHQHGDCLEVADLRRADAFLERTKP